MVDVLAVGGFWLFMVAIIFRKPLIGFIERSKMPQSQDVKLLEARVQQLESVVADLGVNMTELKNSNDFAQKMIIDSARKLSESHKLLIESSKKLTATQKSDIRESSNAATSAPAAAASSGQLVR